MDLKPLAVVHGIKGLVDLFEGEGERDELVDLEGTIEVALDKAGHLSTALDTTKRRSFPDTSSHQLERPRGDLLTRRSDSNDDALSPSLVASLQSGSLNLQTKRKSQDLKEKEKGKKGEMKKDKPSC